ncbi:MAG: cytosolic protein [Methylococcus sp.]
MADDYDSPWKEALDRYFPAFLAFFFPAAHADIAWEAGYRFLDKELQKVVRDAELGRRWADKLVEVTTRDGETDWVLVHVEVQGRRESNFAGRMFSYNYRLFDRYARPVISLAVLGEGRDESAGQFAYGRWGSFTQFTFPVVCLNDYHDQWAELAVSTNPFAVVVQAHLQAQSTAADSTARYRGKLDLVKSLYQRGWARQDVMELFRVIDWLLQLPESLEDQLWMEVQEHEEAMHMRYVTSFERIGLRKGLEKGLEKGLQQGLEKGLQQGLLQGKSTLLRDLLTLRFGPLPDWTETKLAHADPAQLDSWAKRLLQAANLEDVFADG